MSKKKYEVIAGARCNMLTAIREGPRGLSWNRTVVCKCDCGKEITTEFVKFRQGQTVSCGCSRPKNSVAVSFGEKFGRLTFVSEAEPKYSKQGWVIRRALFRCDCGKEHTANLHAVRRGTVKSCGCFRTERQKTANATHRMSKTPTYQSWNSMASAARDRGIDIPPKWTEFEGFLSDMGERPVKSKGIERINKKEGYSKRNCRWSFQELRVDETGTLPIVWIDGDKFSLTRAAARMNVGKDTFFSRRLNFGWDIRSALTTPAQKHRGKN